MTAIKENTIRKIKQQKFLWIFVTLLALFFIGSLFQTSNRISDRDDLLKEVRKRNIKIGETEKITDLEETWLSESRDQLQALSIQVNILTKQKKIDKAHKSTLEKKIRDLEEQTNAITNEAKKTIDVLSSQLENVSNEFEKVVKSKNRSTGSSANRNPKNFVNYGSGQETNAPFSQNGIVQPPGPNNRNLNNGNALLQNNGLQLIDFDAPIGKAAKDMISATKSYDPEIYLPPNSYALANVLVGVDASAALDSQNNPRPVLFRITGPARSAMSNGEIVETPIEGCVVNGSATGDLSSEKVYVKLQKMTCEFDDGTIGVTDVKGYVAFGGKAGVRGRVISREGDLLTGAFLSGALEGFGKGVSANTQKILNPFSSGSGSANTTLSATDLLKGSAGEGIAGAAGSMKQYLIKRAEQIQPVIEMPAGLQNVNLVFLEGAYLTKGAK